MTTFGTGWTDQSALCDDGSTNVNLKVQTTPQTGGLQWDGTSETDCGTGFNLSTAEIEFEIIDGGDTFGPFTTLPQTLNIVSGTYAGETIEVTGTISDTPSFLTEVTSAFVGEIVIKATFRITDNCGTQGVASALGAVAAPPVVRFNGDIAAVGVDGTGTAVTPDADNVGNFDIDGQLYQVDGVTILPPTAGCVLKLEFRDSVQDISLLIVEFDYSADIDFTTDVPISESANIAYLRRNATVTLETISWANFQQFFVFGSTVDATGLIAAEFQKYLFADFFGLVDCNIASDENSITLDIVATASCGASVSATSTLPVNRQETVERHWNPTRLTHTNTGYLFTIDDVGSNARRYTTAPDCLDTVRNFPATSGVWESAAHDTTQIVNGEPKVYVGEYDSSVPLDADNRVLELQWDGLEWVVAATVSNDLPASRRRLDTRYDTFFTFNGRPSLHAEEYLGWWTGTEYTFVDLSAASPTLGNTTWTQDPLDPLVFYTHSPSGAGGSGIQRFGRMNLAPNSDPRDVTNWTYTQLGYFDIASVGVDGPLPASATPGSAGYVNLFDCEIIGYQNGFPRLGFADIQASTIRVIQSTTTLGALGDWEVVTLFGGTGFADGTEAAALFNSPRWLTRSTLNPNEYFIADRNNHRIRLWDSAAQTVSTYTGDGTASIQDSGYF